MTKTQTRSQFAREMRSSTGTLVGHRVAKEALEEALRTQVDPIVREVLEHAIRDEADAIDEMERDYDDIIERAMLAGYGPEDFE